MEEKAAIVEGETVCSVARRHGLTPQQLFTWRRQARGMRTAETPAFVPAVAEVLAPAVTKGPRRWRLSAATSIELEIARVVVRIGPGPPTFDRRSGIFAEQEAARSAAAASSVDFGFLGMLNSTFSD